MCSTEAQQLQQIHKQIIADTHVAVEAHFEAVKLITENGNVYSKTWPFLLDNDKISSGALTLGEAESFWIASRNIKLQGKYDPNSLAKGPTFYRIEGRIYSTSAYHTFSQETP